VTNWRVTFVAGATCVTAAGVTDRSEMYSRQCKNCGEPLGRKRWDAKFCGQNCRKAWSRRKDQIKREFERAELAICGLLAFEDQYPDLKPLIQEHLKALDKMLSMGRAEEVFD
jgi:hypothetical protein